MERGRWRKRKMNMRGYEEEDDKKGGQERSREEKEMKC